MDWIGLDWIGLEESLFENFKWWRFRDIGLWGLELQLEDCRLAPSVAKQKIEDHHDTAYSSTTAIYLRAWAGVL